MYTGQAKLRLQGTGACSILLIETKGIIPKHGQLGKMPLKQTLAKRRGNTIDKERELRRSGKESVGKYHRASAFKTLEPIQFRLKSFYLPMFLAVYFVEPYASVDLFIVQLHCPLKLKLQCLLRQINSVPAISTRFVLPESSAVPTSAFSNVIVRGTDSAVCSNVQYLIDCFTCEL